MQIKQNNNLISRTPKNNQIKSQFTSEKYNQIYDEEFVSLINSLNESIKEYYKVSKNNISQANSILILYDQQAQAIINLMNLIVSTSSYDKLNELFEQIPKILEVIKQMKINTNSNNNNLTSFFDDAKILFKSMKFKRKEKLNELNNNNNNMNYHYQTSSDSYNNSFNQEKMFVSNLKSISNNSNNNLPVNNSSFNNINAIYSRIMILLNSFSDFNYMISKINFEESNKFNNLQNNVKKELENFFNFLKKYFTNNTKSLQQNKSYNDIKENKSNQRSKSTKDKNENQEIEKLKKINVMSRKKLIELNNQLKLYKNKIVELEMKNKNLLAKLKNNDNAMMNFENKINNNMINNNQDFNNALSQKDQQILNLEKQLRVFKKNEDSLNVQINNLNNQFSEKLGEYEYKITNMSEIITKQKNFITKLQNELNTKNIEKENFNLLMDGQPQFDLNKNIEILKREIKEKDNKIKAINEELINYQRKEKANQKQIAEMNNNIFNYENIIKKKDELINSNYKDNDFLKIKLENENLKKQIIDLKNTHNNYLLQNQGMMNGNINSYEMPEMRNQEYLNKINELNQEIQNLKQTLSSLNESKAKLELDINKKNDELEGFKQVIFKLQNKLEKTDDEEKSLRKLHTERSESKFNNCQSESNLKDKNKSNKNLNKSFEMPKDSNTQLMNKFL